MFLRWQARIVLRDGLLSNFKLTLWFRFEPEHRRTSFRACKFKSVTGRKFDT